MQNFIYYARTQKMNQVGIVSWGYGCASGLPGVYARVTSVLDFIQDYKTLGINGGGGDSWQDDFYSEECAAIVDDACSYDYTACYEDCLTCEDWIAGLCGETCDAEEAALLDEWCPVPVIVDLPIEGELTVDEAVTGDTSEAENYYGNAANDNYYVFKPPSDDEYTISTCGSKYDTHLRIFVTDGSESYTTATVTEIESVDDVGQNLCTYDEVK